MKKIDLTANNFNGLDRNLSNSKVQRVWIEDYKGMGVDLGKTKKSIIYNYKSPVTGKIRIIVLESFAVQERIDTDTIDDIKYKYRQLKGQIRNGIDPLAERDTVKAERKKEKEEKKESNYKSLQFKSSF